MDTKRVLLATVLCLGVLLGWNYLATFMGWVAPPAATRTVEQTQNATQTPASPTSSAFPEAAPVARFTPSEGKEIKVTTPLYSATFHTGGGILRSFTLSQYAEGLEPNSPPLNMISAAAAATAPMGLLFNGQPSWTLGQWSFTGEDLNLKAGENGTLTFEGELDGVRIKRTLTFNADTYLIEEKDELISTTDVPRTTRMGYTMAVTPLGGASMQPGMSSYNSMRMVWDKDASFEQTNYSDKLVKEGMVEQGNVLWAGTMSNYFLAIMLPSENPNLVFKSRIQDDVWRTAVEVPDVLLNPGEPQNSSLHWWLGPKERALLAEAPNDLAAADDMGFFTFIALPFVWILVAIESLVGNYGLAIILLTVLIKILFWPLMRKSYHSMEQMKKIQPKLQEIQKKYANDKQRQSAEMMQLYKTYGVNPMGGCLPLLLQLPIFVALYQALLMSIDLRHASFITFFPFTDILWLADLSSKDPLYITPIIMGITMFLQQWMAPAVGDPTQRKVMMLMPVIFTFLFLNFPSGLVLYWLTNNVLSIAQQWWTLRKIK